MAKMTIKENHHEEFNQKLVIYRLACTLCKSTTMNSAELTCHYLTHSLLELAKALIKIQVEFFVKSCESLNDNDIAENSDYVSNWKKENKLRLVDEEKTRGAGADSPSSKSKCPSLLPHTCHICNKVLGTKRTLVNHMFQHTGKRPLQCQLCPAKFIQSRGLKCHVMQAHSKERPFKCNVCNKGFVYSFYLEEHMVSHTGELAHQCSECGKRFSSSGSLTKHSKRHNSEKSFECDLCNKFFTVKVDLKTHLKFVHSKDKL